MRRVLPVVVVLLLVTAGCLGGPSGSDTPTATSHDPTESVDPTATSTDTSTGTAERTDDGSPGEESPGSERPTSTPTQTPTEAAPSSGDDLAPGVDDSGVRNVTALQTAHYEALNGSSFTIDVTEERRSESFDLRIENGSEAVNMDIVQANTTSGFYIRRDVVTRFNESRAQPKVYSYGSTAERFGALFVSAILLSAYPRSQLSVGEFELDGTVTRDGEELVRLRAVGVNETAVRESRVSFSPGNLTDMSGTVLVRSDGLVRNMSLELASGSGASRTVSFSVSEIGSTAPPEPGWLREAPQFEGALAENGTVFELAHAGGATLPAGSTLSLESGAFGGGLALGNVTLPTSVSPGDTVYLYATGSMGNTTAHASVNEVPAPPSEAIDLSERSDVQVAGTLDDVRFVIGTPSEDDLGL